MENSEFISIYNPYEEPNKFLDVWYDKLIYEISTFETRSEVVSFYKVFNNILKDYKFWMSVDNSKYYSPISDEHEKYIFQQFAIQNLRIACQNILNKIEKFLPYKDYVFNKLKEISLYILDNRSYYEYSWEFIYPSRPSIHAEITTYLNYKIDDHEEINFSDYLFLFPIKGLTQFGWDNFYDIADEVIAIIKEKYISPNSLIIYYYKKFNRDNSRYVLIYNRLYKEIKMPKSDLFEYNPQTISIQDFYKNDELYTPPNHKRELTEEEENFLRNDNYEKKKGVNFSKIKQLENLIMRYYRLAENNVRQIRDLPRVDEGWISETNLYHKVKNHLKPLKVIQHARLQFLGKQHLDIFIPFLNLAIEYQGIQHFEPVDYFGGVESYIQNLERDERKRNLCRENGVSLIYVKEGYNFPELSDQIDRIRDRTY